MTSLKYGNMLQTEIFLAKYLFLVHFVDKENK